MVSLIVYRWNEAVFKIPRLGLNLMLANEAMSDRTKENIRVDLAQSKEMSQTYEIISH